jgi:hypothetical protein
MVIHHNRLSLLLLTLFVAVASTVSCSHDGMAPKKELAPLAGVWDAKVLTVPDPADLSQEIDLIGEGASYALSVLSTGQYTAVFNLILLEGFETGTISVAGNELILTPTTPPGTSMAGTWTIEAGVLVVDAIRELDLNGDGTNEVVIFHLEFEERED